MKIEESFETYNEVENSFMEVAVSQQEQDMLSVRNCLLEKEQERGVEMMQEMASGSGVLNQHLRPTVGLTTSTSPRASKTESSASRLCRLFSLASRRQRS